MDVVPGARAGRALAPARLTRQEQRRAYWEKPDLGLVEYHGSTHNNLVDIIIGFYGKWNGHPSNDRRMVTMDLGLAVSNDALHYSEPIPDFPIVSAAEDSWSKRRGMGNQLRGETAPRRIRFT